MQANKPQEVKTSYGNFTRLSATSGWHGFVNNGGTGVHCYAMDVEGKPYPQFIERIPDILRQLSSLQAEARRVVPQIDSRFELDSVNGDQLETDFSLCFYYEESEDVDSDDISITVYFKDGRVVSHEIDKFEDEFDDDEPEDEPLAKDSTPDKPSTSFSNEAANPWDSP